MSARRITRARIVLLAADDRPDDEVTAVLHTSRSTVERVRRRFVQFGLEAVLNERPRPGAMPKLHEREPTLRRVGVQQSACGTHLLDHAIAGQRAGGPTGGRFYFR